jgi:hypothetical protein
LLCVLALAACSSSPGSLSPEATRALVQSDVKSMQDALYNGDVDTLLGYTHGPSLLADREQAKMALKQFAQDARVRNRKVESFSFPGPPDVLQVGDRRFAVVPTLTVISERDQRVERLHFQLGVLEPGAESWKYVDGSRINASTVHTYFPTFPADYQFPKVYQRKL